jgi:pyruvate-formate lyase-activating enzyme
MAVSVSATARDPLLDGHGRCIGDLRVSVTDRCNFRCQYCMPAEGLPWLERSQILTFEEIERLVGLMATMGVTDVRLTGGEPLVRKQFPELVARLARLPLDDLSITTNGYLLERDAGALAAAGLKRINVSIDSLQRDRFFAMTRRDALPQVLRGLEALAVHPEAHPIKVNAVALRGFTEQEVLPFASFAYAQCDPSSHVAPLAVMHAGGSSHALLQQVPPTQCVLVQSPSSVHASPVPRTSPASGIELVPPPSLPWVEIEPPLPPPPSLVSASALPSGVAASDVLPESSSPHALTKHRHALQSTTHRES